MPHFADPEQQMYYPPNLLFYFMPTWYAVVLFITLHLGLSATLTDRWLREYGVSPPCAILGGLAFSLSGFPVLHSSQLSVLAQVTWLPAGLLTLERLRRQPARRAACLGSLYGFLAWTAGSPQILYISLCLWLVYAGWRKVSLKWLAVTVLLAILLALPLLLAEAEFFGQALRGTNEPLQFVQMTSWPPSRVWSLLAPFAYASPDAAAFHELTFYVGPIVLVLAAVAAADLRRLRSHAPWLVILAASILLALGSYSPLFG
ncbi:MAG: hypothetical protein ACYCW6_11480, partial [Candidatus Xenobia bacterium]